MIRIFDRYLILIFVRSFLICFCSLVGLYIVIDAFSNLDEFSERSKGLRAVLGRMGTYYGYRVTLFFDRLSSMITTIAAMFTFSWIQRTNELMPMLAAGVPIHRIIAPVFCASLAISGLTIANQELLIPRIAKELQGRPDDDAVQTVMARAVHDSRGILLSADRCYRAEQRIRPAFVTLQPNLVGTLIELNAKEGRYVPPGTDELSGGWILSGVTPADIQCNPAVLKPLGDGDYFLFTTVTFDHMVRKQAWFHFSTSRELIEQLGQPGNPSRNEIAVVLHSRFTRPLATVTLLFLGLPFVLSGTDRRMVSMVGMSLLVSIAFQVFTQLCQRLGTTEYLSAPLAAWLPVLVFGTAAVGLYDWIKT